jgi:threonine/homoserine/homoserine lactone efflux protein
VTTFWQGLTLGFMIAAPVGPVGVLCLRRTLVGGRLGAALADAVCGWLAAAGLTALSTVFFTHAGALQLVGGAALVITGLAIARRPPPVLRRVPGHAARLAALLSAFVLTAANPVTLLAFLSAFASLNLVEPAASMWSALILASGIFCGSAAWWCVLCAGAQRLRARLGAGTLERVNRAAGALIALFGAGGVVGWLVGA